ncbi:MAG: GyrI-like domain-containing protein [Defluviitaleaceae bacterium]|nr:GyrI-like domain-containing protein [Defluviitaleaceae bacterium]
MKIEITNLKPQIAVAMKETSLNMESVHEAIGEMAAKLMAYLAEQGKDMAGAPYLAYFNATEDFSTFDIEWGFPISEPVPNSGEIFMSQTCEGKAITAMHKGSYSGLGATYSAIMDYAKENSLNCTGVVYDYYLNNPDETPESELLTQVIFSIK